MRIVNNYVFGLGWSSLEKGRRKAIAQAKADGADVYGTTVLTNEEKEQVLGICEVELSKEKHFSAASFIAMSPLGKSSKNSAFMFSIQGDEFGLVCLLDGLPVAGYDIVGARDDVMSTLEEFFQFAAGQGEVSLYGADIQGAMKYDFWEHVTAEIESVAEKQIVIKPTLNIPPNLIKGVVLGGVLFSILGGWYGYEQYSAQQEAERLAMEAAMQQRNQKPPKVVFEQALAKVAKRIAPSLDYYTMVMEKSNQPVKYKSWSRVFFGCDSSVCKEAYLPDDKNLFNYRDWDGFEQPYKMDFDKSLVELTSEPVKVDTFSKEDPLASFSTRADFLGWIDRVKNAGIVTIDVSGPNPIDTVKPYKGGPDIKAYEIKIDGPFIGIAIPSRQVGLSIREFIIEKPKGKGQGKFAMKATFFVNEGIFEQGKGK